MRCNFVLPTHKHTLPPITAPPAGLYSSVSFPVCPPLTPLLTSSSAGRPFLVQLLCRSAVTLSPPPHLSVRLLYRKSMLPTLGLPPPPSFIAIYAREQGIIFNT